MTELSSHMVDLIKEQETIVLALDDSRIDDTAKKVAFYYAMIDAATDDPMDDPEEHDATVRYLQSQLTKHTELYMKLVNNHL